MFAAHPLSDVARHRDCLIPARPSANDRPMPIPRAAISSASARIAQMSMTGVAIFAAWTRDRMSAQPKRTATRLTVHGLRFGSGSSAPSRSEDEPLLTGARTVHRRPERAGPGLRRVRARDRRAMPASARSIPRRRERCRACSPSITRPGSRRRTDIGAIPPVAIFQRAATASRCSRPRCRCWRRTASATSASRSPSWSRRRWRRRGRRRSG